MVATNRRRQGQAEPESGSARPRGGARTSAPSVQPGPLSTPPPRTSTPPPRNQRTREPVVPEKAAPPPVPRVSNANRMVALRASIRGLGDRVWQRTRGPLRVFAKLAVLVACVIGTIAVGRLIERQVRT